MRLAPLQVAPEPIAPVTLVTEPPPVGTGDAPASWLEALSLSAGLSSGWMLAIVVASIVVACGAVGVVAFRASRNSRPELRGERRLRSVARACGLRSRDVALLRALATAHGSASPVALALCGSAMGEAAGRLARREPARANEIDRLVRRLGVGVVE
jgi:hypothetical protein